MADSGRLALADRIDGHAVPIENTASKLPNWGFEEYAADLRSAAAALRDAERALTRMTGDTGTDLRMLYSYELGRDEVADERDAALARCADLEAALRDAESEIRRHHADFERWEEMAAKGARQIAEVTRLRQGIEEHREARLHPGARVGHESDHRLWLLLGDRWWEDPAREIPPYLRRKIAALLDTEGDA